MYYLDYSAGKLSGQTIKNAGYGGVIRYIDSPANLKTKHTDLNEYRSHQTAGLQTLMVMQTTTTASDGGYAVGQDHARRALAGANYLGYNGPVFFTNDRTTLPNPASWRAYLDGASSILGKNRVGAYGFRNAIDAAVGHATYFWQAGRRSDLAKHTDFWQDNNTQVTVGGILCDRNLVINTIPQTTQPGGDNTQVKNLIIGKEADGTTWVGDGVTRRWVQDENELSGLQYWIEKKGGDKTVYAFSDPRVLGVNVTSLITPLLDDEGKILAAVANAAGPQLDYEKFVADLTTGLANKLRALTFKAETE